MRTVKTITAAVRGTWIVTPEWLQACDVKNEFTNALEFGAFFDHPESRSHTIYVTELFEKSKDNTFLSDVLKGIGKSSKRLTSLSQELLPKSLVFRAENEPIEVLANLRPKPESFTWRTWISIVQPLGPPKTKKSTKKRLQRQSAAGGDSNKTTKKSRLQSA